MPEQKIVFTKGMDSDTTDELIQAGSQRFRLNVRALSAELAALGAIEDVLGNTLVTYSLPSGANTCIGSYEDLRSNKVYFFVFNAASNHSVLEYSVSGNSIQQVVAGAFLNFDINHLITGINVVELDNDTRMLYWTDNFNEPKKINIQKGIYWSQGNYTLGYPLAIFNPEWIMRIKQPGLIQPLVAYGSDPTRNINYLSKKLFQFKSLMVYDDFEQSAWSPISITPYPVDTCTKVLSPGIDNYIAITVPTGSEIVTRIKIAARLLNTGDFFEIVDLDKKELQIGDNSNYTYYFLNEKIYNSVNINESIKLFDSVPLLSQAQEIIKGERLVDGLITEGYDPTPIDAQIGLNINTSFTTKLFNINGFIWIKAPVNNGDTDFSFNQPVYYDATGQLVWGGLRTDAAGNDYSFPNLGTGYGQILPAGGFTIYLAGTNFFAVSAPISGGYPNYLPTRNTISNNLHNRSLKYAYTLKNIPPGDYVMRIAYHGVTSGQLNSGDISWQNQSTNVLGVAGNQGTECHITVDASGNVIIGSTVYPTGAGLLIPDSYVADLTGNYNSPAVAINGYLKDRDQSILPLPPDTPIELSRVNIVNPQGFFFVDPATAFIKTNWVKGVTYTDHNGYFFYSQGRPSVTAPDVVNATVIGTALNVAKFTSSGSAWASPTAGSATLWSGIFKSTLDPTLLPSINIRTVIKGVLTFTGSQIQGYIALTTNGHWAYTDVNGAYSLTVYGDTIAYDSVGATVRTGSLIWGSGDNCTAVFSPTILPFNLPIGANTGIAPPYNYVVVFQAGTTIITSALGAGVISAEKRGNIVEYGIVYYDHGNRSGLTNVNNYPFDKINPLTNKYGTNVQIPFYTELQPNGPIYGGAYPIINWDIYSLPPAWATHWQWVKFRPHKRYIQFAANSVQYLTSSGVATTYNNNPAKLRIDVSNILDYAALNQGSTLKYTFAVGDRLRLIKDTLGNLLQNYFDFPINGVDTTTGTLLYCDVIGTAPLIGNGIIFEIWNPSPVTTITDQIYYEFGETYNTGLDIHGNLVHLGQLSSQKTWTFDDNRWHPGSALGFINTSGVAHNFVVGDEIKITQSPGFTWAQYNTYATITSIPDAFSIITNLSFVGSSTADPGSIVSSASGTFSTGDTFYRMRNMPYFNKTYFANDWIEDPSFNDLYVSDSVDIGRPNRYDPDYKQVTRPATVYYSEKLIPETKINGLSSVFDTNFESYERIHGGIYKFHSDDQVLYMFQELKCGHIPIDQLIYNAPPSGQQVVGASDNVLSPQAVYYEAQYGIGKNPESFSTYGGSRYGVDVKRGVAWRLSRNGLTPISSTYQQKVYFMNACRSIVNSGQKVNIYGVFDIKFGEYIASIQPYLNVPGDTIAFNEDANGWSTHYSYLPENMCTAGINMISFKNGQVWLHNQGPLYNNFYGVQYDTQIWVTCNDFPSNKKVLQAISLECSRGWNAAVITPNGQASDLQVSDFQMKEGYMYAAFGHDTNTPNVVDPWINGDPIRDNTFLIKLSYPGNNYVKIFAVNLLFQDSPRSNR